MRPLKLNIAGFGPYAGEQKINFESLGKSGLYLITGDTGAGKTTIFDAITFALFGEPSGESRSAAMLRSKYARPEDPTYVKLTFQYDGKEYTVVRSPKYSRVKTRGSGTTDQNADAQLHMPDGNVIGKIKEVDKSIREIIGLTREQFAQVSMISQGEFRKLLQANTEERQKIFRDIFDTGLYAVLQARLSQSAKDLNAQCGRAQLSIRQYIGGMVCDADSILSLDVRRARNGEMPTGEVAELFDKLLQEDNAAQNALNTQLTGLDQRWEQVLVQLTQAKAYQNAKIALAENERAERAKAAELEMAQNALTAAQNSLPEQEELQKRITAIEMLLPTYDELEAKSALRIRKQAELSSAEAAQNSAQQNKSTLSGQISAVKEELKGLGETGAQKEKLSARKMQLTEQRTRFRSLITDLDALEKQRKELKRLQAVYQTAEYESTRLTQMYEIKNKAFLDEQAGIIAANLAPGARCPVCGSVDHPQLAQKSENAPTEADVKSAKTAADRAQQATNSASAAASRQKGIVATAEEAAQKQLSDLLEGVQLQDAKAAAELQSKQLAEQIFALDKQIFEVQEGEKRKAVLEQLLPKKEAQLADTEALLASANEQIASLRVFLSETEKQIVSLREKLSYPDKRTANGERANLLMQLECLKAALANAEKTAAKHREELAGIRAAIEQLKKQLSEGVEADVAALEAERQDLLNRKNMIALRQKAIHARITANESARKNIAEKAAELNKLEEKYIWVNALSETANGNLKGQKEKIMLETYIQTTYFDRILQRANLRLQKMSGGQYDLKRRRNPENYRSQSGLELDIVDHINATERSVNTLSGGEAFLASLALALGLSDEVQMSTGIRLDTLFVDEGFGSLDSEALSKAYSTLASLTEGNRLVGIISHVAELKERVDKQIVVTKNKAGGSCIHPIVL